MAAIVDEIIVTTDELVATVNGNTTVQCGGVVGCLYNDEWTIPSCRVSPKSLVRSSLSFSFMR